MRGSSFASLGLPGAPLRAVARQLRATFGDRTLTRLFEPPLNGLRASLGDRTLTRLFEPPLNGFVALRHRAADPERLVEPLAKVDQPAAF